MEATFSSFDLNGNGKIDAGFEALIFKDVIDKSLQDVKQRHQNEVLQQKTAELKEVIRKAVSTADEVNNNDGRITSDEFKELSYILGNEYVGEDVWLKRLEEIGPVDINTMARKLTESPEIQKLLQESVRPIGVVYDFMDIRYMQAIENGEANISECRPGGLFSEGMGFRIAATEAQLEVYDRFTKADADKDGSISFGNELLNFYKGFSSKKNGILTSDDMDRLTALTGIYFLNPYTYIDGKKVRAVDLNKNTKVGRNDKPGFHRFTKLGESLVFGDLPVSYKKAPTLEARVPRQVTEELSA